MAIRANGVFERKRVGTKFVYTWAGGLPTLEYDVASATPEQTEYFTYMGAGQILGDTTAKSKNKKTGESASAAEKHAAMARKIEILNSGQISGDRDDGGTMFLRALGMAFPKFAPEKLAEINEGLTPAQRTKMTASDPKLLAAMNEIRAERAAGADITDVMALLNAPEPEPENDETKSVDAETPPSEPATDETPEPQRARSGGRRR